MLALRLTLDTVGDMTSRRPAAATLLPIRQPDPAVHADVLDSVAGALRADGDDWAALEAWVLALTLVMCAALQAVPEELHDFL